LALTSSVICQSRNSRRFRASRKSQILALSSSPKKMKKMLTNLPWRRTAPNIARHRARNVLTRKLKSKRFLRRVEVFKAIPFLLTGDSRVR